MTSSGERGPQIAAEEAAELQRARERMIARHKLIERIIRNNEMQLRNDSARGGAEIELVCVKRDIARDGGRVPQDEHARLVAEREWLNSALLEFDSSPSDDEHKRSGHA